MNHLAVTGVVETLARPIDAGLVVATCFEVGALTDVTSYRFKLRNDITGEVWQTTSGFSKVDENVTLTLAKTVISDLDAMTFGEAQTGNLESFGIDYYNASNELLYRVQGKILWTKDAGLLSKNFSSTEETLAVTINDQSIIVKVAQGLTGAAGPTGATGPQGPAGATGAAGADGVDGLDGADGGEGPEGAEGPEGPEGPAGPTGLTGATGATGAQGPIGPAGPIGTTGATGPAGEQGLDGADGADGAPGLPGADGADGEDASLPTGSLVLTAGSTAPTGTFKANGAAVSRTTYADLFAVIGTDYGVGDGSTTFDLPDWRGEFFRGWDDSRGADSGRALNSFQDFAVENATGTVSNGWGYQSGSGAFTNGSVVSGNRASGSGTTRALSFSLANVINTASETRPRNFALLACIAY